MRQTPKSLEQALGVIRKLKYGPGSGSLDTRMRNKRLRALAVKLNTMRVIRERNVKNSGKVFDPHFTPTERELMIQIRQTMGDVKFISSFPMVWIKEFLPPTVVRNHYTITNTDSVIMQELTALLDGESD